MSTAAARDLDELVGPGVAAGHPEPDARHEVDVAVDDLEAPGLPDEGVVLRHVARPAEAAIRAGVLELAPLDDDPGAREAEDRLPVRPGPDEPAAVIEVHVGQDDAVDVARPEAERGQPGLDPRPRRDPEAVGEPRVAALGADPDVDEDRRLRRADQERPEREVDPVPLVGRRERRPHHAGHDPEDRPAVEPEAALVEEVDPDGAEPVRRGGDAHTGIYPVWRPAGRLVGGGLGEPPRGSSGFSPLAGSRRIL